MRLGTGKIIEVLQHSDNLNQALIRLGDIQRPTAGQYLSAHRTIDGEIPVGVTLFPGGFLSSGLSEDQILTAPGLPSVWRPGDELTLRGPIGKGFQLPIGASRLAVCAFGPHSDHLLPLADEILSNGGEVALFTDGDFSNLPARIEVNRLEDIGDACRWADLLACSTPLDLAEEGFKYLSTMERFRCPTQVLIYGQYPCSGIADCAVCAIRTPQGKFRLACLDGPVFDWQHFN